MRFICDDNLGKLARYLRFLGFDTLFKEPIDDNELLRLAAAGARTLLTRDSHLETRIHPFGFLLLEKDEPLEQLRLVVDHFGLQLDTAELFKRCSICNEICKELPKSEARDKVFPYILATHDTIRQCPNCHRYYWKGSHYSKIMGELKTILPPNKQSEPG